MQLRKDEDQNRLVTKNFKVSELISKSPDLPVEGHYLDDRVVNALQFIRDYYGVPIRVTSTYRTELHNTTIGGAEKSQHRLGRAIDFQPLSNWTKIKRDFADLNSAIHQDLEVMGIEGVGVYDSFIHIDTRQSGYSAFWDARKKKGFDMAIYEDGMKVVPMWGWMAVVFIVWLVIA